MFGAFLDACVLLPVALCDTLLRAADYGLYAPTWSPTVLDEVRRAFTTVRADLSTSSSTRCDERGFLASPPKRGGC